MEDSKQRVLRRLTLLLDVLVLPVSGVLAFGLHAWLRDYVPFLKVPVGSSGWALLASVAVPLWVTLVLALGLDHSFEQRWTRLGLLGKLLQLHLLWFLGLTGAAFLTNGVINRAIVALLLGVNLLLTWLTHALVAFWVERRFTRGESRDGWLLVGSPSDTMRAFVRDAALAPFPPRLVGLLSSEPGGEGLPAHRGPPEQVATLLHQGSVDRVIFFPPLHHPELASSLVRACELHGTPASFVVDYGQRFPLPPTVELVGDRPCLTYDWVPPRRGPLVLKGLADVVGAALILACITPLLLLLALAVWLTMGRPVLFAQERAGLNGRRFRMLKFRTMVRGAEAQREALAGQNEMSGPVFKITDDPRVTRLGRFLRRWSLDELPQFLNVLLGSMSLVGPRPLPVQEQQDIEGWYRRRLSMKPGITGLWQVSGRSDVDFDEWMRLDLRYVEQWSLWLDLKLLLLTLPAVLSKRGAK